MKKKNRLVKMVEELLEVMKLNSKKQLKDELEYECKRANKLDAQNDVLYENCIEASKENNRLELEVMELKIRIYQLEMELLSKRD